MWQTIRNNQWLTTILVGAFVIRVLGIGYGLPFHFFGDEEALVFGALKMLEMKTIFPVFHWEIFKPLLYYPPFLSYVYLIFFIPVLGIQYLWLGMPSFAVFKDVVVADPSAFWYAARWINVCFAVANVYVVYRIAHLLFKNQTVGLFSALFLATSFIDSNVAFTARHWTATLFFSLLALWFVLRALHEPLRVKYLSISAGLSLGISFGMGYLVFYLPVIGCLYLFWGKQTRAEISNNLFYFGSSFIIVGLAAIALHPQPFIQQVLVHTYSPAGVIKSIPVFLQYYASVLWNYETFLLIFSVIGLAILCKKERKIAAIFLAFYAIVGTIMYIFLWNIPRYLTPLLPIFAMSAGYGLYMFCDYAKKIKPFTATAVYTFMISGLVVYYLAVLGRFGILLHSGDTRIAAKEWLETLAETDSVVVYSGGVRPIPSLSAAGAQATIAPGSLRSAETVYLQRILPEPEHAVNVFPLFFIADTQTKNAIIKHAVTTYPGNHYMVIDSWTAADETQQKLLQHATLVKEFIGSDTVAGSDSPDGAGALFIGGEAHTVTTFLPRVLFAIKQLGPTISIYKLN